MIYEVTLSQINANLHERIRMTNGVDTFYVEILKKFQEDRLFQEEGDLRSRILMEIHQEPYLGNLRYQKMISVVKRHFFWPKLKADIAMFIAKC